MLQMQYFTDKLTAKHIDNILNNYKIRYKTINQEIESKLNVMIQLFLNDIKAFLSSIAEITQESEKIKDTDRLRAEINCLTNQLKEKKISEHRLQTEIQLLTEENNMLKEKMNSNNVSGIDTKRTPSVKKSKQNLEVSTNKVESKTSEISKKALHAYEIGNSYSEKYKTPKNIRNKNSKIVIKGVKTREVKTSKYCNNPTKNNNDKKSKMNLFLNNLNLSISYHDPEIKNKSNKSVSNSNNKVENQQIITDSEKYISHIQSTSKFDEKDQKSEIENVLTNYQGMIDEEIDLLNAAEKELLSIINNGQIY